MTKVKCCCFVQTGKMMQRNDPDLVRHYCLYTKSVCDVILNQIRPKQCDFFFFFCWSLFWKFETSCVELPLVCGDDTVGSCGSGDPLSLMWKSSPVHLFCSFPREHRHCFLYSVV